jgi:hypothetical protein
MLKIEITSEHGGQIPVLGTFEPGETKVIPEHTQMQFEAVYGYPVAQGFFTAGVTCTLTIEESDAEVTSEAEKGEEG